MIHYITDYEKVIYDFLLTIDRNDLIELEKGVWKILEIEYSKVFNNKMCLREGNDLYFTYKNNGVVTAILLLSEYTNKKLSVVTLKALS